MLTCQFLTEMDVFELVVENRSKNVMIEHIFTNLKLEKKNLDETWKIL